MNSRVIPLALIMMGSPAVTQAAISNACTSVELPNQAKDANTIKRIEQAWLTAEYQGNARFLECLLEPGYQVSDKAGTIRSGQDLIDRVAKVKPSGAEVPKLETVVVLHGDAASAHSTMRTTDKAGNLKEVHFVDTYTFHDGRWFAFSGVDL